jgi:uncharacterized protein YidB (DUF937 family)
MGILDGAIGSVLGGLGGDNDNTGSSDMLGGLLKQFGGQAAGGSGGQLAIVMMLVQKFGGVEQLLAKFTGSGMGDLVASWVGGGANLPVSGSQVHKALGDSAINDVATKLGVAPAEASSSIATMLPELINKLTPKNAVDGGSNELLMMGLAKLTGK